MPPVLQNTAYYANPKVDALLDEALAEADEAKRSALYEAAQRLIWADVPVVMLVFENASAGSRKGLAGFRVYSNADLDFSRAHWLK